MLTLRASNAPRWMECALSVQSIPGERDDTETDEAREGTCAAWVADICIREGRTPFDLIGTTHPNGWVVDIDMARHLVEYVELATGPDRQFWISEIHIDRELPNYVHFFGTSDLHSWNNPSSLLPEKIFRIDDLKFGYEPIEPTSWQLNSYLALAYLHGIWQADCDVILGIFQPRAIHSEGPYRTEYLSRDAALEKVDAVLQRIEVLGAGDKTATPGKHCNHCPKAHMCEALAHSVYSMWSPVTSQSVLHTSRQQLADELDMLNKLETILTARKTAVKTEVEETIRAGHFVPGYVFERRVGKRQLRHDADTIEMMTGVRPVEKEKMCTPAELERRGVPKSTVDRLSTTPYTGEALKRVHPRDIARQFEKGMKNGKH